MVSAAKGNTFHPCSFCSDNTCSCILDHETFVWLKAKVFGSKSEYVRLGLTLHNFIVQYIATMYETFQIGLDLHLHNDILDIFF